MNYEAIDRIASSQHGVIGCRQLLDHASRHEISRLHKSGALERVFRGIYRTAGASPSWCQDLMTAVLATPGAVASHRAAARLYGLLDSDPDIEITISSEQSASICQAVVHRSMDVTHRTVVQGIPATTVSRTIADIAPVVDMNQLERCLDGALRMKLISIQGFQKFLRGFESRGRKGIRPLNALVARRSDLDARLDSELEAELLRVIRRARLPLPKAQVWINTGFSRQRVDFAYPQKKIVIEVDSWMFHASRNSFDRDRERDLELLAIGWRTLRWTKQGNSETFLEVLRMALQ